MLVVKNLPANSKRQKRLGLNSGSGRSPRGEPGNPLQYSCLENPMDRGTWWATVHGVTKSQTWLKWLSIQPSNAFLRLPDFVELRISQLVWPLFPLSFLFLYMCVCVCVCVYLFVTHKVIFCGKQLVNPEPGKLLHNLCFDSDFQGRLMFYLGTQVSRALLLEVSISSLFIQDPGNQLLWSMTSKRFLLGDALLTFFYRLWANKNIRSFSLSIKKSCHKHLCFFQATNIHFSYWIIYQNKHSSADA